nr:hypothetical protein [Streptomyces sp. 846.5]
MENRSRGYVWAGVALATTGLGTALVAWVGLDRANQYIGVPAAVAAFLGLALSVYGVFAPPPQPGGSHNAGTKVTQVLRGVEIRGNSVMVAQDQLKGDAEAEISQTVEDVTIEGSHTMTGQRGTDAGADPA